jgi:hypothetical protein
MNNSFPHASRFSYRSPTFHRGQTSDPCEFDNIGDQELTRIMAAAATALRSRGVPLPPPPPTVLPAVRFRVPPPPPPRGNQHELPTPTQPPIQHNPQLLPHCSQPTMQATGQLVTPIPIPPSRVPDMWDNAKIEQYMCAGLKTLYDGSPDRLIPTLNLIHIRRQNEVWASSTYILQDGIKVDLVLKFSMAKEDTVLAQAKSLWNAADASLQSHTRGTTTYYNRLLGVFLMNSLTPEFSALLHSRIDPNYCCDGPLLLFTMCQNIHRNHLAFVESVKHKIRSSTLSDYSNDIQAYLRFLQNNLKLISSTGADASAHNDLIPHILKQLRSTTIPLFQQSVLKWQRDYFENTLQLTPASLVLKADQEHQILKHAGQWVETIDPSVAAMQAQLTLATAKSGDLIQHLVVKEVETKIALHAISPLREVIPIRQSGY